LCRRLPGFGDSADCNRDADPRRMARILVAGIDRLIGAERFYQVGFSYGGIIGSFVSRLVASRIGGFVIVGGVGFEARRHDVTLSSWRHIPDAVAAPRHPQGQPVGNHDRRPGADR
jgi:pimeloyl-ACP methyl ester carboxylesterase